MQLDTPTDRPSPQPSASPQSDPVGVEKFRILRENLGAEADWRIDEVDIRRQRRAAGLVLDMDSPSAKGVPDGDDVRIEMDVETKPKRTLDCPPPAQAGNPCELRKVSGKTIRIIRALPGPRVEPEMTEANKAWATNYFDYVRADGVQVSLRLNVQSPHTVETAARQAKAQAWMAGLDQAILTTVLDPRIDVDPPAPPYQTPERTAYQDAVDANARLFHGILGKDWVLQTAPFGGIRTTYSVALQNKTPTAEALREAGTGTAWASLDGSPQPLTSAEPCGANADRNIAFTSCALHTLPDGRHVLVGSASGSTTNGHSAAEGLRVVYERPDGTVAIAQLVIVGDPDWWDSDDRAKLRTFIAGFEAKLTAAATADGVQHEVPVD